jgi:hypothetical protein
MRAGVARACEPCHAEALVPGDEDRAVGPKGPRRLDLRHLAGEEVVELTHAVVRPADVVAVLAVVGDDEVEGRDVAAAERGVDADVSSGSVVPMDTSLVRHGRAGAIASSSAQVGGGGLAWI